MVKVNLLKPGSGAVKRAIMLQFGAGRLPKALFLLSLIVFLGSLALNFYTSLQKKNLSRIDDKYQQAEKIKEQIKALNIEKEQLIRGINLLGRYLKRDILWSDKLSQMRDLIPQEAWLTKLSFNKKSDKEGDYSFYLSGGLISDSKVSPIGILSSFVNQLKANKEFSADFDIPVLTDLRSQNKDGLEVMVFSIEMPLKKEKVVKLNENAR